MRDDSIYSPQLLTQLKNFHYWKFEKYQHKVILTYRTEKVINYSDGSYKLDESSPPEPPRLETKEEEFYVQKDVYPYTGQVTVLNDNLTPEEVSRYGNS